MTLTRRELLAAIPALYALPSLSRAADAPKRRLGVAHYSYALHIAAERASGGKPGISEATGFIERCHALGAGGVQVGLGVGDRDYVRGVRKKLEDYGLFVEGSVRLPRGRADVERFAAEVRCSKEAGAKVLRTVLLGGRRYEAYRTAAAFRKAAEQARQSLRLAEPVVARHDVRLAVENHKDFRAGELVDLLKRLDSRHVGVCVDTGNSIALLEDPTEVVETFAPWAFSVHLKDMGVAYYDDGFLLAEVPLGTGFLDLRKMIALVRKAHPETQFCLEMITRDPLKVPCLTAGYWATLEDVRGEQLARALALVYKNKPAKPLPRWGDRPRQEQLKGEEDNVVRCLTYARKHLGL